MDLDTPEIVVLAAIVTYGMTLSALSLGKGLVMESQHWVMLLVVLAVGYVLGRLWDQPATMAGLP